MHKRLWLAVLLPFAALAVQWIFWDEIKPFVWFLFFPIVFFSARFTGFWGGLLSTVLSIALVWFFFIPPQLSWVVANPNNLYSVAVFLLTGYLFSDSQARLQRASKALEKSLDETKVANAEITTLYKKTLELDELKTSFFANMSHEIRTPMNAILGLTYLLKSHSPTPEQTTRLDKIASASRHLLSIINDILDFSKIESGKFNLEKTAFPVSSVLDHTKSLLEDAAKAKGLVMTVNYENVPTWLVGDQTRLRQALLNYANNALKFTDHGTIAIKCSIEQDLGDAVLVRFEVKDSGIGIEADKIPELFQAFKQVDASTTRKYGGTGLGLAITQRLAGLMGGSVGVESKIGSGSTFWFTAKLDKGEAVKSIGANNPEKEIVEHHSGAKILLVEDDLINQEVAHVLLTDAGLKVEIADNGQQAVSLVKKSNYDLILMDIQMPVMDGIEATSLIRHMPDKKNIPILALTANVFEEYRQRCTEAGMNDFVAKPVDPSALFATLLKWLPSNAGLTLKSAPLSPESQSENYQSHTDLYARLLVIEGLDINLGLQRLNGNMEVYWPLLKEFVGRHKNDMTMLRNLIKSQVTEEPIRIAHTLKSSAGTLGLNEIQNASKNLEDSLTAGNRDVSLLLDQIDEELKILTSQVEEISKDDVANVVGADVTSARLELTNLLSPLKTGDFMASQNFKEHLPLFRASLNKVQMVNLEKAMNGYDFPSAVKIIEDMLSSNT